MESKQSRSSVSVLGSWDVFAQTVMLELIICFKWGTDKALCFEDWHGHTFRDSWQVSYILVLDKIKKVFIYGLFNTWG